MVLAFRLECRLQLPRSNAEPVPETLVDSATLCKIPLLAEAVLEMDKSFERLFNSPVREGAGHILHWVTEYKREGLRLEEDVVRQTMMAISSGLYQRRALGFPGHYVFGTAHSGSRLRVFAGTWTEKSARVREDGEASKKGEETQAIAPGTDAEGSERSSKRRLVSKGKMVNVKQPRLPDDGREVRLPLDVLAASFIEHLSL
jgi:hypothetical protein